MSPISSQDFRNIYQKFYSNVRDYLWPFEVLEILSDVEVDIYSAFIDIDKLKVDFNNLGKALKDVLKDDAKLNDNYNEINNLINEPDVRSYLKLYQVNEIDPEKDKVLKIDDNEEEVDLV